MRIIIIILYWLNRSTLFFANDISHYKILTVVRNCFVNKSVGYNSALRLF